MFLHDLNVLYDDFQARLNERHEFRMGEPSGMLVAIAKMARWTGRCAAGIERWARKPGRTEYLPRIPAR